MKTHLFGTALAILANIALSQAFYTDRDDVLSLTPQSFGSAILDTDQLVAVEFYAPWCGHCQKLAPEWKKVASNLKGLVNVGAIDCDVDENKSICAMYQIQGFPTIKVFKPELRPDKRTGQLTKTPSDYQGPRDAKSMVDYLLGMQPSDVKFIKWNERDVKSKKSISYDDFLATKNNTLPKSILFTNKPSTTPLYKALSVDFKDRLLVGEVKQSEKSILAEYNVDTFPTLLVIHPEQGVIKFEGKLKRDSLKEFMEKYALPGTKQKQSSGSSEKKTEKKEVVEIKTDANLSKQCQKTGNSVCVIGLTGDDDKQETVDVLNELLKGGNPDTFEYGWIHAERSSDIIKKLQLVEDYPALIVVNMEKKLYRPYVGSFESKNINNWLKRNYPDWSFTGDLKLSDRIAHDEL
ncbi:thioredoxin-domain-containing protein [Backusella circina FSU 941]|nr:thioredoxin-domain-containing protein [Backusella circina FSU 941]